MTRIEDIKFVKIDPKEFDNETERLNEEAQKDNSDLFKWFKDAGRPLKK